MKSDDSNSLRVRLMALLAIYDLLPPSLDKTAFPDFNPPPEFDSTIDLDSIVHSLALIGRKLQIPNYDSVPHGLTTGSSNTERTLTDIIVSSII
jgi:hypothetical protein